MMLETVTLPKEPHLCMPYRGIPGKRLTGRTLT